MTRSMDPLENMAIMIFTHFHNSTKMEAYDLRMDEGLVTRFENPIGNHIFRRKSHKAHITVAEVHKELSPWMLHGEGFVRFPRR